MRSHVFTYGHRNMQGIDFGANGTLYASEQGPKTDDEVNILVGGDNYGWPHVAGFRDDKAYQYARWADATTPCENSPSRACIISTRYDSAVLRPCSTIIIFASVSGGDAPGLNFDTSRL